MAIPLRGRFAGLALILTLAGARAYSQDTVIQIDGAKKAQHLNGFGAQIWAGDTVALETLADLGMKPSPTPSITSLSIRRLKPA